MAKTTKFSKYKTWVENNPIFSKLMLASLIISFLVPVATSLESVYLKLRNIVYPTFDSQIQEMTQKGCILFKVDQVSAAQDLSIISDGYKQFWRKHDISHASNIKVSGYTYSNGASEYNLAIGERHAHVARNFIINSAYLQPSVAQDITVVSYGEEKGLMKAGEYECGAIVSLE